MAAQLRYSAIPNPTANLSVNRQFPTGTQRFPSFSLLSSSTDHPATTPTLSLLRPRSSNPSLSQTFTSPDLSVLGGGGNNNNTGGSGGGGDGWGSDGSPGDHHSEEPSDPVGPLGFFLKGWRSRVSADPEFPFKVLMEELVGVTSCVLGDMASRPNFGLNELDFVFSTLVVGAIVNFVLMYLLAPAAGASSALPGIFASCPTSHMFEPGAFSLLDRIGTFVFKGVTFAAVGFVAGLAGTALSNGLIALRKKMDPEFETPNKAPPTVLNALTWALHLGVSSNFRYQTLNGLEFVMARGLPPAGFKATVVVMRCLNNVLGGMSFVVLARMTGSQKVEAKEEEEKERLIGDGAEVVEAGDGELQSSESQSK